MNDPVMHVMRDAVEAAKESARLVSSAFQPTDRPVLLLTSGGSAIRVLEFIDDSLFSPRVTLSVLDDRFTRHPVDNNFLRLTQTKFFERAKRSGVEVFDTSPRDTENLEEAGRRFDTFLHAWRDDHPDGRVVIFQGIGPDGHTAGIMPYPEDKERFEELFQQDDVWAVGYDTGGKSSLPQRITATASYLSRVDFSIVYMCGEDKKGALEKALETKDNMHEIPGRVIHQMPLVHVFTDIKI